MTSQSEENAKSIFEQQGQTIHGDQTNVTGDFSQAFVYIFNDSKDALNKRWRDVFLRLVENTWIKGVLAHSLLHDLLIQPRFTILLDAVNHSAEHEKPYTASLLFQFFCGYNEPAGDLEYQHLSLLILAPAGFGKTTLLLTLAQRLIVAAKEDPLHPMPVILNLSSWAATETRSIRDWLIYEMSTRYLVQPAHAQKWLETNSLFLLIDGFDEVPKALRSDCIVALNQYIKEYSAQMIVCSRTADYLELDVKLAVNSAIELEPLQAEQIWDYLERLGDEYVDITQSFQRDPILLSIELFLNKSVQWSAHSRYGGEKLIRNNSNGQLTVDAQHDYPFIESDSSR